MTCPAHKPAVLVLSQVYIPDPAAVGQQMADAAAELARRGFRVVVFTSRRGYENPAQRYPARETLGGVDVRRLPLSSFGKQSLVRRMAAGLSFVVQCILRGVFVRKLDRILVSTSPPVCLLAALMIHAVRRAPIKFWVMDINPDQTVALGKLKPGSALVRLFDAFNRLLLRRSENIIVLDRFMAARINRKVDVSGKMSVIPPWPHDDCLERVAPEPNPFRSRHGLNGCRIIMYSGNLGLCTPVTTILRAALRVADLEKLVFLFVGGGLGRREIEEVLARHRPRNIQMLPYQPLAEIRYSLSAADVHLVTLGEGMAGIVHPCKVYGAMAAGRPILYLGPADSFIMDIMRDNSIGWHAAHGAVDAAERIIREIARLPPAQLALMGDRARAIAAEKFTGKKLCSRFCDAMTQ